MISGENQWIRLDHRGTAPECAWDHGGAAVRGEETDLPFPALCGVDRKEARAAANWDGNGRRRGSSEGAGASSMFALATRWAN
jgi:hypothetical protein